MSRGAEVGVVATGVANVASVMAAIRRCGHRPIPVSDPQGVTSMERLVLPGVGTFGAAMEKLQELQLVSVLRSRMEAGRPTLAICLGLQLLAAGSEESPGVAGLSLFDLPVQRLTARRVPQLGWNQVIGAPDSQWIVEGYAYYANSYALRDCPAGWRAAWTDYEGRWVAALERGAVLACQFHPELSGKWGLALLDRWLSHQPGASAQGGRTC